MINLIGVRIPISYEQAAHYFDIANGFLVLALILGVVATSPAATQIPPPVATPNSSTLSMRRRA